MKIPKRKKLERIEIMKPPRVALSTPCPNCGGKGHHFMPPVTWTIPGIGTVKEPGEYICEAGKPMIGAELATP